MYTIPITERHAKKIAEKILDRLKALVSSVFLSLPVSIWKEKNINPFNALTAIIGTFRQIFKLKNKKGSTKKILLSAASMSR